jgi:hypothetical protein
MAEDLVKIAEEICELEMKPFEVRIPTENETFIIKDGDLKGDKTDFIQEFEELEVEDMLMVLYTIVDTQNEHVKDGEVYDKE